jgi:lipopolysaccharide transport system permease protein
MSRAGAEAAAGEPLVADGRETAGEGGARAYALPEKPLVVIEPSLGWMPLNLRELWAYRELLYLLLWRDVKVRYKQTVLGAAWAVIQPLSAMLLFALLFGRFAGMPSDGVAYPVFAYAGLVLWTFFANAVTHSGNSLITEARLVEKVYFPRLIIPIAAVGAGLVDYAIGSVILVVMMVLYQTALTWALLLVPFIIALGTLLAVGVGVWMAALNVKYRDIRYALPFLVQVWMFATPIIYPLSMVPGEWRWLLMANPMTGIVEAFRAAVFGREFDWVALGISAAITGAVLLYGTYTFRRMERGFTDVI